LASRCCSPSRAAPAARLLPSRHPLPRSNRPRTPGDALIRSIEALTDGDEAAYRRIVVFAEPSAYAQALARQTLAGARLHRAVRDHGVTGKRVRSAGFDTNETLLIPAPATGKQLDQALRTLRQMQWKIEGDLATAVRPEGDPNPPRAKRIGSGWVILATDPQSHTDPEQMRVLIDSTESTADITIAGRR
jgi:hypothetical protein